MKQTSNDGKDFIPPEGSKIFAFLKSGKEESERDECDWKARDRPNTKAIFDDAAIIIWRATGNE